MERKSYETSSSPRARRSLKLLRWAAVFFFTGILATHAIGFKAALDRDSILLGENVTLTLTVEDAQVSGTPSLPAIHGLEVVGTSSSQQNTIVNGKMNSVQSFIFTLNANKPGDLTIPALQMNLNGQLAASAPLKLKVLREDPDSPPPSLATNMAFLWLVFPKKELYVGEAVVGELRLYLRNEVQNIQNTQIPALTGDGFILGKYNQGQQFKRNVGNASFTVIPMPFAATAIKTGPLTVGPVNGSVTLLGGRPDFFGRYSQSAQATLTLDARIIQSQPLPVENIPPLFTGAVGNYTMTASVGPTNVAAGDPITVRVQISGRGALDGISLPQDQTWDGFKTYPPTSSVAVSDQFGFQGTKTFEQIISPENTDLRELPALTFSYFDPDVKQFRTLTHPATKLTVRPGGASAAPVIAAKSGSTASDTPPPQQDIVPIKQRLGTVTKTFSPLITQPAFYAVPATPLLAFLAAFIWRKRADAFANNPRLRRQRQVEATIRTGLENIRQLAAQNKSDEFFAELVHLLQEKLGERLDTSASGITEAVINEKLRPRGIPDTTLTELHELFQACNLARYAPVKSSQELAAIIPRLESALKKLDEVNV